MTKEEIKELINIFSAASIGKIQIKQGEFEISLEKQGTVVENPILACPPPPAPTPININVANDSNKSNSKHENTLTSPMVGTFYEAPSPGATPFVKVGQCLKKGDTICIIEAMKIMNEIEAEYDCKIISRLVDNGQPVEFGTDLFVVEKL